MKKSSVTNLSVKGEGKNKEYISGPIVTNKKNSTENKSLAFKPLPKERQEKTPNATRQNINPSLPNSSRLDSSFRRNTKAELEYFSLSPIIKPGKFPDVSFLISKDYRAFASPRKIIIKEVEENLDRIHRERCKSEAKNASFKSHCNSNINIEVINNWAKDKNLRQEEVLRRFDLPKKIMEYTAREAEDYHSDEEDVTYNYMDRIGRIRKLNYKLIDVSRHPDYEGNSGFISMQSQIKYAMKSRTPIITKKERIEEAEKIKNCLARRNIRCNFQMITSSLMDDVGCKLPRGGEGLLKF
ncbi:hypothetical protein SteCoe_2081 [Stentor coeruleus]|uniref:Uncharacterized protein n=1 Tax=Stentor coeruleus TaxID=5963 RepID=A0A1R2D0E4_9CILI|nr:hypothetical protein SteCoe_2081 [Stentor coeruleus]